MITAAAAWLWQNVAGNLVASAITVTAAWFWKIRPHFKRVHEHIAAQQAKEEVGDGS